MLAYSVSGVKSSSGWGGWQAMAIINNAASATLLFWASLLLQRDFQTQNRLTPMRLVPSPRSDGAAGAVFSFTTLHRIALRHLRLELYCIH
jgi:hypothetical protein